MSQQTKRRIYTLNGLDPEVVAVAFAKCSRSPQQLDAIAKELDQDKTRSFHEKWVVGYGHSSVAEHAILHIAFENVSIVFTKIIEDNRLASFTEKSTRYQDFSVAHYYTPPIIERSPCASNYHQCISELFATYTDILNKLEVYVSQSNVKPESSEKTSVKQYTPSLRNTVFDAARYLLPTAALTNLGMTINARQLEYTISKLLSNPLEEAHEIGKELKYVSSTVTPTLIKYAHKNSFIQRMHHERFFKDPAQPMHSGILVHQDEVQLVEYDTRAIDKMCASLSYAHADCSYAELLQKITLLSDSEKETIIRKAFEGISEYDRAVRACESISYTFDVLIDFGAFRDIQRHRMCTQLTQNLTTHWGFSTDELITKAGVEKQYNHAMETASRTFANLQQIDPFAAQYVLPLAFKKRVLMTLNLRELHHLIRLRTAPTGHASYRKICQRMHQEINKVHPVLAQVIPCCYT